MYHFIYFIFSPMNIGGLFLPRWVVSTSSSIRETSLKQDFGCAKTDGIFQRSPPFISDFCCGWNSKHFQGSKKKRRGSWRNKQTNKETNKQNKQTTNSSLSYFWVVSFEVFSTFKPFNPSVSSQHQSTLSYLWEATPNMEPVYANGARSQNLMGSGQPSFP